jgi:adenylate kinase family enzyme
VTHRVHLFGASGSGTTTLGRALASALEVSHLDTDDYYWHPTDPPFTSKRGPAERVRLIEQDLAGADGWVLSGSLCSWGDPLLHRFTLAVFLCLDPAERLARLARREQRRHGERIEPGGDMHEQWQDFMSWAESYDTAVAPVRSRHLHEAWMARLRCPVLRLDSKQPLDALVGAVADELGRP